MPDSKVLLQDAPGKRVLLLGNEAIARGILEAGVSVVTTYPGTPASEIGDSVSEIAPVAGLYMEYSVNEIVAVQVAAGAANCGVRALTAMKHVGLNVAADLVMTLAYTGVRGGYVIVTADDPECYSSQNEQDNRFYALLSNLPCLEPSDPEEAKKMTVYAVEMSEKLELPVLLRTTTRVSHTRGPVAYGNLMKPNLKGNFVRDVKRLVMVPANSRPKHEVLLRQAAEAKEISEKSPYNKVLRKGGEIGIISSGSAYNCAVEAATLLGLDAGILKLGMTHPLPEKKIAEFLKTHKRTVVVEELEPYLEMQIKAIAKDHAPNTEMYGKMNRQYLSKGRRAHNTASCRWPVQDNWQKAPDRFQENRGKIRDRRRGFAVEASDTLRWLPAQSVLLRHKEGRRRQGGISRRHRLLRLGNRSALRHWRHHDLHGSKRRRCPRNK